MTEAFMPGIKTINGHTYIKIQDLADDWHTTTSHILRTGKPNQVPEKYRRTIDGHTWCDVEGLRYRLSTMKRGGRIPVQLHQFLDRFPIETAESWSKLGPLEELVHEKDGTISVIRRSTFQNIDDPSLEEMQDALENRQIIYRYENDCVQVLAQTLSNHLGTRTSSLLAVSKKQGVPRKFIHREWKRTWVDLEGLKKRVEHTEHESTLLKHLKQVIHTLDRLTTPDDNLAKTAASASVTPGMKQNPIDVCDVAVEANKRAVHNTERINDLDVRAKAMEYDIPQLLNQMSHDSNAVYSLKKRVERVEKHVDDIEIADQKAVQAMAEGKTPLDALSRRVSGLVTHTDRLDGKTDGLVSRVSVLEDTSKWLSWTLAGVVGVRFLGLMLRLLRRK